MPQRQMESWRERYPWLSGTSPTNFPASPGLVSRCTAGTFYRLSRSIRRQSPGTEGGGPDQYQDGPFTQTDREVLTRGRGYEEPRQEERGGGTNGGHAAKGKESSRSSVFLPPLGRGSHRREVGARIRGVVDRHGGGGTIAEDHVCNVKVW